MIVAFGTSTPTSITVVATRTSTSVAQPLVLCFRRARDRRLGLLDQRTHDVRLPAGVEMRAEPRVRVRRSLGGDPARDDRLARRRRLRDLAHGEVAVHGQRERARDRRRSHVQGVRRAPLGERAPLLDAEAMLLVDDSDGESRHLHVLLDQRVRPDENVRVEIVLDGPCEQRDSNAELRAVRLDRQEVLLCERLGRRHQRALIAVLDRAQQCVERDDRLPRADVALEEPLHRRRAPEVDVELGDRTLLMLGQGERQRLAIARNELARLAERGRLRLLASPHRARDPELEHEQLVVREPRPAGLGLVERARRVQGDERVATQRQLLAHAQLGRKRIRNVAYARECALDELAQPRGRQLFARGIDRCEVRGRRGVADVVGLDLELAAPVRPAHADGRTWDELPFEPRLVEPRCGHGSRLVREDRLEDRHAPARLPERRGADDAGDGCFLLGEEVRDRRLPKRSLVVARAVLEQIADRPQAEARELRAQRGPDAGQRLGAGVEAFRARRSARRAQVRVQAREADRSMDCCRLRGQGGPSVRPPGGRQARPTVNATATNRPRGRRV
jgi:hypothetical protein